MIRLAHRRRLSSLKKVVSADLTKLVYVVGDPEANFETYRLPGHGQKDKSLTLQTAKFSDVKFEESRERLSSTRWQFIGSNILAGAGGYLIYYAHNLPLIGKKILPADFVTIFRIPNKILLFRLLFWKRLIW